MTAVPGVGDLATTDPALVKIIERFTLQEVPRDAPLPDDVTALVRAAALIATGAFTQLHALLLTALDDGVPPVSLKEVAYASVPHEGLGRGLEAVRVASEALTERGVALPLPSQTTTTDETRAERGLAVQQEIVATERVEAMYAGALRMRLTSSATSRRTASATTTRAAGWTCPRRS